MLQGRPRLYTLAQPSHNPLGIWILVIINLIFNRRANGVWEFSDNLGFSLCPYRSPLGRFGEFWENLYSWGIMWAYNPASLRGRPLLRLRRSEMSMSTEELLRRYST